VDVEGESFLLLVLRDVDSLFDMAAVDDDAINSARGMLTARRY
jgi:hypothetical protein